MQQNHTKPEPTSQPARTELHKISLFSTLNALKKTSVLFKLTCLQPKLGG